MFATRISSWWWTASPAAH
ncbi:trp operon leader peptide [Streptomyces hainanensis]|uniref:Trp operon leader peptide n=1 Tax=Streptomyces hainanensis TaxID=402648 RepID=A0A4R4SIP9_9ACTN|nr:trp operon leader peptide [Streptomyces hainanensis]